jgi:hypothetical protein
MRPTKDLLSGLIFVGFGLAGGKVSLNYPLGTPSRMGPGFFPLIVCSAIVMLGALIAVQSARRAEPSSDVGQISPRPIIFVSFAIAAFGVLIDGWGLIAALIALIAIARLAGREGSGRELCIMVAVLIAVAYGIFIYGLDLRLKVLPWS